MSASLLRRVKDSTKKSPAATGCSKAVICIIPIAEIAIGAIYLHECPAQEKIPIYLIVMGVFSLTLNLLTCLPCVSNSESDGPTKLSRGFTVWNSLVSTFLFAWFITGNVWIYSIYQPNYSKNSTDLGAYCDKTLYLFAFWITTLVYILVGLFLLTGCCVLFCFFICGRADPDDDANNP
uniref:Si:dkey-19b23.12 n=1 Tax=Cyprinodon variegatus TaxID=28743 RepID=A0A3Q2DVA0_CYPVA